MKEANLVSRKHTEAQVAWEMEAEEGNTVLFSFYVYMCVEWNNN